MSRELNPDDLESALRRLTPRRSELDRCQLMFLAGQASVEAVAAPRSRRWAWPLAMVASSLLAMSLGWSLSSRLHRSAAPQIAGRHPAVHTVTSIAEPLGTEHDVQPHSVTAADSYLRLRELVVAQGVDAWPELPASGSDAEGHSLSPQMLRQSW